MMINFKSMLSIAAIIFFILFKFNLAHAELPYQSHNKTLGTVNCANSLCHGSTVAWTSSNILQNEYTTWVRLDKHTKAYDLLLNNNSKQIAKKLGLSKPANQTKVCLDCHSHNPDQSLRGTRFIQDEGIGCEGCHGPAEKWIKSHTLEGNHHSDNLKNGMYQTENAVNQAKLCLSCHFGNKDRFVNHRMMGAGHPRVSFELETFSAIQPMHYRVDDDWNHRKGNFNPIKMWAISQVIATQEILKIFSDPKLGYDGVFPELVLFDCHACHHLMSDKKSIPRLGVGPGKIRLNDSNILMMMAIAKVLDVNYSAKLNLEISELHQVMAGNIVKDSPQVMAIKLANELNNLISIIDKNSMSIEQLKKVFYSLINEASTQQYSDYAGAEQAYMAISDIAFSLSKNKALNEEAKVNKHLNRIRKILTDDETYNAHMFAEEFEKLKFAVNKSEYP